MDMMRKGCRDEHGMYRMTRGCRHEHGMPIPRISAIATGWIGEIITGGVKHKAPSARQPFEGEEEKNERKNISKKNKPQPLTGICLGSLAKTKRKKKKK